MSTGLHPPSPGWLLGLGEWVGNQDCKGPPAGRLACQEADQWGVRMHVEIRWKRLAKTPNISAAHHRIPEPVPCNPSGQYRVSGMRLQR